MKGNTKLIIGIIIGVIISSGVSVAATYALLSSDVQFTPENSNWQVGNVEDALNSLYAARIPTNYSTEEKVVGTWIDGKPIYQRTFTNVTFPYTATTWLATSITSSDLSNLEKLISWEVMNDTSNITGSIATMEIKDGYLKVYNNISLWSGHTGLVTITLQYTKTTDQGTE